MCGAAQTLVPIGEARNLYSCEWTRKWRTLTNEASSNDLAVNGFRKKNVTLGGV